MSTRLPGGAERRRWLAAGAGAAFAALAGPVAAQPARGSDLTLAAADGPLRLSALAGRVVYLDFWASWCTPCRLSFAWMARMHERYAAGGLAIVAVGLDAKPAEGQAFVRRWQPPFRIAYDPGGDSARAYTVQAMPSSVLMSGGSLQILLRHAGFRTSDEVVLEAAIVRALQS